MHEPDIDILSPHSDDAAYSVGLRIDAWTRRGMRVRVITCCTWSAYAPNLPAGSAAKISAIRVAEDEAFARLCRSDGGSLEMLALGRCDAPLRPHASAADVAQERDRLADVLHRVLRAPMILAPLALGGRLIPGGHVDHVLVRDACLQTAGTRSLGFYEDLPYAQGLSDDELAGQVDNVSAHLGRGLRAIARSVHGAEARKLQLIRVYESQLQEQDRGAILAHCTRYGGGERLWVDDRWVLDGLAAESRGETGDPRSRSGRGPARR